MAKPNWINRQISKAASWFVLPSDQPATEQRSIGISDTSGMMRLFNLSESGVNVTEETALGITALWAATDIYCTLSATIPCKLYKKKNGILTEETGHPSSILINHMPDDEYVPFDFKYAMRFNALMRGGGGAEIIRNANGQPIRLRLMRYGCTPYKPFKDSKLIYYDNEDGKTYMPEDVYYLPGIMVRDGNKGMNLITVFKNTFGEELTQQMMISNFMRQGPTPGGVYTFTGNLKDVQKQSITTTMATQFGGPENSGKIIPLGNAESFQQLRPVSFADAQMVEIKNFRIEDVARIFRIPVSLLQSLVKPSYNSLEQLFIQWKVTTLDGMFTREDQERNRKLLRRSDLGTLYFETEVDEMMWTTADKRAEYWWKQYQMGSITTNEIREYLNRNPVDGGDQPMTQVNMTTLKNAQNIDLAPNQRKQRNKQIPNPHQAVLFEEKITTVKNGKHSNADAN